MIATQEKTMLTAEGRVTKILEGRDILAGGNMTEKRLKGSIQEDKHTNKQKDALDMKKTSERH